MISFVSAVRVFAAACIQVAFGEIGWQQRTSVQFTVIEKGISEELFFAYNFRIPHNLKTGQEFDVTRRPSRPIHAEALSLVSRGILRPIFCDLIPRIAFIRHTRVFIPAGGNCAARCGLTTWTDIQLRRAAWSRDGICYQYCCECRTHEGLAAEPAMPAQADYAS